jgi:hypothetical protein
MSKEAEYLARQRVTVATCYSLRRPEELANLRKMAGYMIQSGTGDPLWYLHNHPSVKS